MFRSLKFKESFTRRPQTLALFEDALISYCCTLIAEVTGPLLSSVT